MGSASGRKAEKMAGGVDEPLPSGSIIHWSRHDGTEVPVTCGKCRRERSVVVGGITLNYAGLHRDCVKPVKYYVGFKFDSGAEIIKREKGRGLTVKCTCGKEHSMQKVHPHTTGLCWDCGVKLVGKQIHEGSGAEFDWDDRKKGKGSRTGKIAFRCVECGEKEYASPSDWYRKKFRGLCAKHRAAVGPASKKRGIEIIEGSKCEIDWDDRDPSNYQRVGVTCKFELSGGNVCDNKEYFYATQNLREHPGWQGYCSRHTQTDIVMMLLRKTQNGNGHGNGEKHRTGRPPKTTNVDYSRFVEDLREAILKELKRGLSTKRIYRRTITSKYTLAGDHINPDTLSKRLAASGVGMSFEDYVDFLDRFRSGN